MRSDPIDAPAPAGEIAIYLTPNEALVLDAFLARGRASGDDYSTIADQAELRVMWDIAAILESRLPIVNRADYERLLAAAREGVRDETAYLPGL